jgi:hypothetical protein
MRLPTVLPARHGSRRRDEFAAIEEFIAQHGVTRGRTVYVAPVAAALPLAEEHARVAAYQAPRAMTVEEYFRSLRRELFGREGASCLSGSGKHAGGVKMSAGPPKPDPKRDPNSSGKSVNEPT